MRRIRVPQEHSACRSGRRSRAGLYRYRHRCRRPGDNGQGQNENGQGHNGQDKDKDKGRDRDGKHVLLISVDGMHQADLAWYVKQHPNSALANLAGNGEQYANAQTTNPSDSFPGMVAQLTGATAGQSGVYYDDTFNHDLLPAGTTDCAHTPKGAEVAMTEAMDRNQSALDAGQGLAGLPDSILGMTGNPATLLNPAAMPVDPATCKPVYPNQYLQVNSVFDVLHAAGKVTAWSDKHPAYSILEGKSGNAIDDLFTPEINSDSPVAGKDWTKDNKATQQYDGYKVQAVINEIDGYDHGRTKKVGEPAIFGVNFQAVSTAQKLPTSNGMTGGYQADGVTPGPLLSGALDYVDGQLGRLLGELKPTGADKDTTVIVSAKHGQSPTKPGDLTRIDDAPILTALNAAWKAKHPEVTHDLVAFSVDDDAMLLWLSDRSQAAADFAKQFLLANNGTGNDIGGNPKAYTKSGLTEVHAGAAAAAYLGAPADDPRHPDLVGVAQVGTVYTGGKSKIAEHGGANPADRNVPLVVFGPGAKKAVVHEAVLTTQIAPTILKLTGENPQKLDAAKGNGVNVLPNLG
ncbi:alkaline phosphatase family protein [Nocardia tengchongensis]|uniref:Alkaline phosphatase family protein n=1 Tax=Nocardia tengchongensis TaxID=2055889 RepID=A0ABX8CXF8_9NOCA|nr:alkaline phosphatase family protein [Nocardia tengchongensis]QVI24179.1 alkaline phosphatase family protein [Nocardia tengchongensis]